MSVVGKRLAHYDITSQLGAGGMGEVYQARDLRLGRDVAIKVLPDEFAKDNERIVRFQREAKVLALLNHPNIAAIYGLEESGGTDFLVLELVEGATLEDHIRHGSVPIGKSLKLALQIAEALEAAHEKGVIHRDLKPSNIMIARNDHVKVLDFGLAKQTLPAVLAGDQEVTLSLATQDGVIIGTPAYMSPEQLQAKPADSRSDIFSFGIVFYEMLTGVHPFRRRSAMETVSAILAETPQPLDSFKQRIPVQLQKISGKMLAKNPAQRYQSISDILLDLRHVQTGSISRIRRLMPGPKLLAVAGIVLGIAAVLAALSRYVILPSKPAFAFHERDWVITAEFENQTGESIFDKSLDTALRVSLEQSSFVNILPRSRIEQTLQRMKKPGISRIDEPLAREIAQREGINVLLVPSITGIAGSYMISVTLEAPGNGAQIASNAVQVNGKGRVLAALDQLTKSTRRSLGENNRAITERAKQLAKVTTPSLEALKQYSLGIEAHKAGRFEQARTYYENALALDPKFALASASLGIINFEVFDRQKGKQLLSNVVRMTENLTEREKYGILGTYARVVENDIPKAIQYLKLLSAIYPDDAAVHNDIAWFSRQIGRDVEAIKEYEETLRIDPTLMLSYNGLNIIYLYRTGQATAAIDLCMKQIAVDDRSFWPYYYQGWAYLGIGNLDLAGRTLEKALQLNDNRQAIVFGEGNPYQTALYRMAHAFRLQKKYSEARRILQRIREEFNDRDADYDIGVVCQLMQDNVAARDHFQKYRSYLINKAIPANPKDDGSYFQLALASQRMGLMKEAQSAFRKASGMNPARHFEFAQFYSVAGRTEDALRELEFAIQGGLTNYIWLKIHPDLQNLYADPRFQALLRQHIR